MTLPCTDADVTTSAGRMALALAGVGLLWAYFQVFEDTAWLFPLPRGALLACVAFLAPLLSACPPAALINLENAAGCKVVRWIILAVAVLTSVIVSLLLVLSGARSSKLALALIIIICLAPLTLPAIGIPGRRLLRWVGRNSPVIVVTLCLFAVAVRAVTFMLYLSTPHLEDIGQTTLDALNVVLGGHNPYAAPIDYNTPLSDPMYKGYKYLPVMMAIYAPLGVLWDATGLRVTNLILDMLTAGFIAILAARIAGWTAGGIAATVYLLMPIVAFDLYRHGVTDLAAVVPMLAALTLLDKRPGWAGLAAGLALSVKLFPGVLVVACCIPASAWARYGAGVIAGLLPVAFFFAASPTDFINNILWFNAIRPPDSTSIAAALPDLVAIVLKGISLIVLAVITLWTLRRSVELQHRCAFIVIGSVFALLSGPVCHNNYLLWWLPAFCVLLAGPLAGLVSPSLLTTRLVQR